MKLPIVKQGIIDSTIKDINADWVEKTFERVKKDNPIIGIYISLLPDKDAALAGLLVYRLLESQLEAEEMDEDFLN